MTTFKMLKPVAYRYQNANTETEYLVRHISKGGRNWTALYTSQTLRDVLEQAAKKCDEKHWTWRMGDNSGPKECAEAIRAMIKEIQE